MHAVAAAVPFVAVVGPFAAEEDKLAVSFQPSFMKMKLWVLEETFEKGYSKIIQIIPKSGEIILGFKIPCKNKPRRQKILLCSWMERNSGP